MHLSTENLFEFASTIAVLALLAVPYGIALRRIGLAPLRNAALGILFGIAAMGAIFQPVSLGTGVIFDLRALPVGLAGGFLGPAGVLPAIALAGMTPTALGGSAATAGPLAVVIAGCAGIAWFYLARFLRPVLAFRLFVLSLLTSLHLLTLLLLPADLLPRALVEIVPVVLLLNIAGTLVVGGLLDRERCSAERERALDEATMTDPLTGIPNRRGFQRLVERSAQQRGHASGGALLVIDLDHFKAINDSYGHEAGDRVLTELGARLEARLRGGDVVARFGGEEFVVFLPATPLEAAIAVAERLRRAVSDEPFTGAGEPIRVTVSIGAHWDANLVACAAAFASADRALYSAKARGRNCVMFDHWSGRRALAA